MVFSAQYRSIFETVGYQLAPEDGTPESDIRSADQRLGTVAPDAMREYYLVAGRERQFNTIYNRLRPPAEWCIDQSKLIFMEENQVVVVWGVRATAEPAADPPVCLGANNERIYWHKEHDRCSVFLKVMVLWQGVFGAALPYGDVAPVSLGLRRKLRQNWIFVGEVNKMQAFCREGQVVCHLRWEDRWRAFYGASSQEKLDSMVAELQVKGESFGVPPSGR